MKFLVFLTLTALVITGCATKDDLVIDYGDGDGLRVVGAGNSFFCDDPSYEDKEKVVILTLQFADSPTKTLCELKSPVPHSAENTTR